MISITNAAKNQLLKICKPNEYLKIFVSSGGCNGIQWDLEFSKKKEKLDEIIKIDEHNSLLLDNKSVLYLIGSILDYQTNLKSSEFTLKNPNANNSCGCGKSFNL